MSLEGVYKLSWTLNVSHVLRKTNIRSNFAVFHVLIVLTALHGRKAMKRMSPKKSSLSAEVILSHFLDFNVARLCKKWWKIPFSKSKSKLTRSMGSNLNVETVAVREPCWMSYAVSTFPSLCLRSHLKVWYCNLEAISCPFSAWLARPRNCIWCPLGGITNKVYSVEDAVGGTRYQLIQTLM